MSFQCNALYFYDLCRHFIERFARHLETDGYKTLNRVMNVTSISTTTTTTTTWVSTLTSMQWVWRRVSSKKSRNPQFQKKIRSFRIVCWTVMAGNPKPLGQSSNTFSRCDILLPMIMWFLWCLHICGSYRVTTEWKSEKKTMNFHIITQWSITQLIRLLLPTQFSYPTRVHVHPHPNLKDGDDNDRDDEAKGQLPGP